MADKDEEASTEQHNGSMPGYAEGQARTLPEFWSPHMAKERKRGAKMAVLFSVLLSAVVLGILGLYWGADHSLQFNANVLTTVIVDFDGGEVGPFMQRLGAEARSAEGKKTLGFVNEPGSKYGGSVEAVRHALKQEDFWIAIFILSNATSTMNYAYENGNSSYDPSGSVQAYYEEGRNTLVLAEFALPILQNLLSTFVLEFAKQKQRNLTAANSGNAAALERQTAIPIPIAYSLYNEAPAVPSTAEAATEIGTIYLIIVSFVGVLMFGALDEQVAGKVSGRHYLIYRLAVIPLFTFFLSLIYLALSCAWQIRFNKFYGGAGYFIYWMLSWCGMMAFGITIENVNNVFGPPFTPVFFVFWVISNVSTGFYPIELLSNFYRWGLVWPLRHVLIGAKSIIYGTKNLLGLNFGVLLTWVAIGIALQPFTVRMQLRRMKSKVEAQRNEILERLYGKEA